MSYTKVWEESCTREIEKFGGDTVLINEERMRKADRYLKKWIDMTERLLARHPAANSGDDAEQQGLKDLFEVRISGEKLIEIVFFFSFRIFIFYIYNFV